jgi:hypothetical protein
MTIDERVRHAMSGLRLKTDEVGRPASHDEVEALLRKVLKEFRDEVLSEETRRAFKESARPIDEDTQPKGKP